MAITSYENFVDKNIRKSSLDKSLNTSMNIGCTKKLSLTSSSSSKNNKNKIDKFMSPYVSDNKIQLLSQVTEKRFLGLKNNNFMSSFPLAVNIYKTNSDDLRSSKRYIKKIKKSVLTLPNEPAPLPQACTVSDMNDSEYFNDYKNEPKPTPKKKRGQIKRKSRFTNRQNNLYVTNKKSISQLDGFQKSATGLITFSGRDKNKSKKDNTNIESNFNGHDVWSLLRKVNQFKFKPSPPVSQDSSIFSVRKNKKRKTNKPRRNNKDTRVIETCRTEEFAYISSFVDDPRNSCSQSSFDRITVIEKQEENQNFQFNRVDNEIYNTTIPFISHIGNETTRFLDTSRKSKQKQSCSKALGAKTSNSKNFIAKNIDLCRTKNNTITLHGKSKNQPNYEIKSNMDDPLKTNSINGDHYNTEKFRDLDNYSSFSGKTTSTQEEMKKLNNKNSQSKDLLAKLTPNESQHVTGITKVILSKGLNIPFKKQNTANPSKSRLITSVPVTSLRPKITLSEIKRRLNSIKFPLIILGKDQLSSTYTVESYDPPQFAGLDDQIWPFMRMWYDESYQNLFDSNNKHNYNDASVKINDVVKSKNDIHEIYSYADIKNCISKGKKKSLPKDINKFNKTLSQVKPMNTIKNKIVQFLHKNTASVNKVIRYEQKLVGRTNVGTNTQNHTILSKQENTALNLTPNVQKKYSSINYRTKTKRQWASDFIENVIRKVKTGVYYCQDDKDKFKEHRNNTKEECIQTETKNVNIQLICDQVNAQNAECTNELDSNVAIPGFENRLSDLEIEILNNSNRIAVKHCVANITIHFDVTLSFEKNHIIQNKSYSCIPISLGKNHSNVLKCKKTIVNAILPAELCTILPKLMKRVIHLNPKPPSLTSIVDKINSNLLPISEFSFSNDNANIYFMPVPIDPSLKIKSISLGQFSQSNIYKNIGRVVKVESATSFNTININDFLTPININLLPFVGKGVTQLVNPYKEPTPKQSVINEEIQNQTRLSCCKLILPYQFSAKQILPSRDSYNFRRIVEKLLDSENFTLNINLSFKNSIKVVFYKESLNSSIVELGQETEPTVSNKIENLHVMNANTEIPNKVIHVSNVDTYYAPNTNSNTIKSLHTSKSEKRKRGVEFCVNSSRSQKRGFVKLYKKCKSMSSISANKSSMALDKLTSVEDFYLSLGSGKMLSGVLDGNVKRKIMSSIREMKNWMIVITPRQALLILLLANKKDTTNLVRYRPIILQGIAVSRITRASELDMEIEVIERENLHKLTQYEGITYLPASDENQDNLLEELCWIAKTTASDYQKPFNESSERLLKSLLEKRKKLNPSYLRVMARYVGLGLLKAPK